MSWGVALRNSVALGLGGIPALSNNQPFAALKLNFTEVSALDPRITFTRASSATYFNSAGVLSTAANDVARLDYNPTTLAPLGLLIEEQRTNSIRNNTMQGAVAGTPGTAPTNWSYGQLSTLTTEIVSTGVETGVNYVDIRISGTATTTALVYFEANSTVAAVNAQTWATSLFVKRVGGTETNISGTTTTLRMSDSAGTNLGFVPGTTFSLPTSSSALSACRFTSSHTTSNASTAFVMPALAFNAAGAIDFTLRIGLPQLEQGSFATSVIPTTTTALTRAADVATMTGANFSNWFNQSQGTFYIEYQGVDNVAGATRRAVEIGVAGSTDERYVAGYQATTSSRVLVFDGGVAQADIFVTSTQSNIVKLAASYILNNIAQATNGTLGTTDTSATLPTVNQLWFGTAEGSIANTMLNGHIRSFSYYPKRLSNGQLQALTK